jgi:hypothetical protein
VLLASFDFRLPTKSIFFLFAFLRKHIFLHFNQTCRIEMARKPEYDDTISVSIGGGIVFVMIVIFVGYLVGFCMGWLLDLV